MPWKAHPDAPSSLAMPGSSPHAPCRQGLTMNPHTTWARLWTSTEQRAQPLGAKAFSGRAAFLGRLETTGAQARSGKTGEVRCARRCQLKSPMRRRALPRPSPMPCRRLTAALLVESETLGQRHFRRLARAAALVGRRRIGRPGQAVGASDRLPVGHHRLVVGRDAGC